MDKKPHYRTNKTAIQSTQFHRCEVEVAEGLERVAQDELVRKLGQKHVDRVNIAKGAVKFDFAGNLEKLFDLKTVIAAYLVKYYEVPRPRALLGHEHFNRILRSIDLVYNLTGRQNYKTLYVSAAGSDSSVMTRLKTELASNTGLHVADQSGDLLIRVRRAGKGWEVLVRLTPRPLATREWRACNMEGALNASVAHAMVLLTQPRTDQDFLNLACGSGSLMIERCTYGATRQIIGVDSDMNALNCAHANITAAGYNADIRLVAADMRRLPLPDASVDVLCADLPFGQLVGSHTENVDLYPLVLNEAARVARSGASLAIITHEIRLMENLLAANEQWIVRDGIKITLGGLHPRIFLLRKAE